MVKTGGPKWNIDPPPNNNHFPEPTYGGFGPRPDPNKAAAGQGGVLCDVADDLRDVVFLRIRALPTLAPGFFLRCCTPRGKEAGVEKVFTYPILLWRWDTSLTIRHVW